MNQCAVFAGLYIPATLSLSVTASPVTCRYFVEPSCNGLASRVHYASAVPISYGQYSYAQPSGYGYSGSGQKMS